MYILKLDKKKNWSLWFELINVIIVYEIYIINDNIYEYTIYVFIKY